MKSATKTDFPISVIESLTQHQFGSSTKISQIKPLVDGWFNSAYEVSFANHKPDAVLRIAPPPEMRLLTYENDMMAKELLVNQSLQDIPDIPVPLILGWNFNRDLINHDYMFVERLEGIALNEIENRLTPTEKTAIYFQLGEIIRRVYTYEGNSWGYFGGGLGHEAKSWREAFSTFIYAILADGEDLGVAIPETYENIRDLFDRCAYVLDDIHKPSLVHWDLWPGNIFILRVGGKAVIEGITDWERAFWGDPESEPAIAASYYGADFFNGLGRELTKGPKAAIRHCLYGLYLSLVMLVEAKIRFENADHLSWVEQQLKNQIGFLSRV
jgi:aminoglycoside phosphotransferase (APT) family kinase protein